MIQGKEQVSLKQAQELFCLREVVVSSNHHDPRSEPEAAKKPLFLKSHSKRAMPQPTLSTQLTLS